MRMIPMSAKFHGAHSQFGFHVIEIFHPCFVSNRSMIDSYLKIYRSKN